MTCPPTAVEIEGLWTTLGTTVVHRDVDLEVRTGEVLAIVGGSGSGKTTLLREMLGLLAPTRGRVEVLGADMSDLSRSNRLLWSSRCGVVFQNGALFSALSAFENVALPIRETSALPEELLRDFVLTTLQATDIAVSEAQKLPAELSGGMVKRVALARALVLEPELLFLDEPTSGLAPDQCQAVIGLLARLKREFALTVVVITHDLAVVTALADRVAVLADQRILTVAPPQEVAQFAHPFVHSFFHGARFRSRLVGGSGLELAME